MIRVNLLGVPRKAKRRIPTVPIAAGRTMIFLLVIVLVAVPVAQYWRYNGLQGEGEQLDAQVQQLQAEKVRLAGVRSQHETAKKLNDLLGKRIEIIEGLKARRSGPVQLLGVIASTVSSMESLWLTRFEQAGQNITIEGIALSMPAVANFLTELKNTKAFSEVEIREAYQDNTVKELKSIIFTLTAQLSPPSPAS